MGRIKRIGTDTTVNYTLEQTSAYDEARPAATQASWGTMDDVEAMDQSLEATTGELAREGALLTFARIPDRFEGVHVKIRPTYDSDAGEAPTLELWTHKQNAVTWTRRRAIQLGGIAGVESGRAKVFQLDLAVSLTKVDAVWITMNPGPTGSPTMRFLAIHAFGRCNESLQTPGDCDDGTADPSVDCSGPSACEVNPFDPRCIVPTLTCADLGYEEDADGNCIIPSGRSFPNDPTGNQPVPRFEPPAFPTVDLCDPAAIDAFKQLLTPEQLAYFEELLAQVELPCLDPEQQPRQPQQVLPINQDPTTGEPIVPAQPAEVYFDPRTLNPATDPRGEGTDQDSTLSFPFFFFYNTEDLVAFEANYLVNESLEIQTQYQQALAAGHVTIIDPDNIAGTHQPLGISKIEFVMSGVPSGTLVGIRALLQYPRRRTLPFPPPGSPSSLTSIHNYRASYRSFGAYIEGPCITTAGFAPNGWARPDVTLWPESTTAIPAHFTFRKTGENILTLEPDAATYVNEIGESDPYGRIGHMFDLSDAGVDSFIGRQDGFVREFQFCIRQISGQSKYWITQEMPYALYVHIELRPGFVPFESSTATISSVMTTVTSTVGAAALVGHAAAAASAGDPPPDEIDDFYRNTCPFS